MLLIYISISRVEVRLLSSDDLLIYRAQRYDNLILYYTIMYAEVMQRLYIEYIYI